MNGAGSVAADARLSPADEAATADRKTGGPGVGTQFSTGQVKRDMCME